MLPLNRRHPTGTLHAGLLLILLAAAPAQAQLPQIRLSSVFPPGGRAGSSLQLTVTGSTDADEATELIFSHPGIQATAHQDDAGKIVANAFDVTVADTVPAGYCDVRLRGLFGISNPRMFRIDTLAETAESEPNNSRDEAAAIELNHVINARSNAQGDIDVFRVPVAAGQTIVFRTEAARIDSQMQPVLEVMDDTGRRLQKSRRVLDQEASVVVTSDRPQTLTVKVHDLVYSGGEAFPYRLTVDTRPLVDVVWPPVLPAGAEAIVTLLGRHLPDGQPTKLRIDEVPLLQQLFRTPAFADDGPSVGSHSAASVFSTHWWTPLPGNTLPAAVCRGGVPVYRDTDPIVKEGSQLTGDFTVAGRLPHRGEDSIVRFSARKGMVREIDVISSRLGVTANPMLIVERVEIAADGQETLHRLAAETDGRQDPGGKQLPTLTTDPSFRLECPEDGIYQLRVRNRDATAEDDPRLLYVANVREEHPDFQLVAFESIASADGQAPVTTGAVSIRRGGHYELPVYVFRKGGHAAAIQLNMENLPDGVTCRPATIPAGGSTTTLVLQASEESAEEVLAARVIGRSGDLTREAQVATLLHAGVNGLPRAARHAEHLLVSVMKDVEPFTVVLDVATAELNQDQQLLIPVQLTRRGGFNDKVDVTFSGQPGNVDVSPVSFPPDVTSATARLFFKENAGTGTTQLVAHATATVPWRRNPWKAERAHERVAAVQQKIDQHQTGISEAQAAIETAKNALTTTEEALAALDQRLTSQSAESSGISEQLVASVGQRTSAIQALSDAHQIQLETLTAAETAAARLDAVTSAAEALDTAATSLAGRSAEVLRLTEQLQELTTQRTVLESEKERLATERAEREQAVAASQAAAAALTEQLQKLEEEKMSATEAAQAADEATKPANVNVRVPSTPVQLHVHPAAGKITASVPGGGTLKRSSEVDATVNITRKNGAADPVQVTLIVPEASGVSATPVDIPADQTSGTVRITVAADAPVGDIAHAVFRATTLFQEREASFDAPVSLKVSE